MEESDVARCGGPGFLPGGVRLALLYNAFYSSIAHNKEVYGFDVKTTYGNRYMATNSSYTSASVRHRALVEKVRQEVISAHA